MEKELSALKEKILVFEKNDQERVYSAIELTHGHSYHTASILLELGMDADTIIASLLLSSLPDRLSAAVPGTEVSDPPAHGYESQLDQFGPATALLVQGVRKIDKLRTNNKTIHEAQNIRNMIFALTSDIRVIIIKLAEKLDELRRLDSSDDDGNRKTIARECLDIYAPITSRLGISWIKNEMEDLSLKFLNREVYQQIKNIVAEKREQRDQFLISVQQTIRAESEKAGMKIETESRAKHFYSVYMKMRKRAKSADEIYDLSAIRIICETVENCYTLLGLVHRVWKPVAGCFDDYIAMPKPNGYQSLHTSVLVEEERRLEIQIRTREMHQVAENGVASHWLYKKGTSRDMVRFQDIDIVNRLKGWKQGEQDASRFSPSWLEDIKQELFKNWIYVFTPQGKVIELPAGATPLDFAYSIHTAVGEHCIGAKANGSIIPLTSELKNTQIVEILTSISARPHFNWLSLAKTSKARSKIRAWLEKNDTSFIADKKKPAADPKNPLADLPLNHPAPSGAPSGAPDKESVPLNTAPVMQKVFQSHTSMLQVRIEDEKNLMVRFARCCNPVKGDAIVGYVSRGRGIIIHRKNCINLANNPEFEKRKIEAEWENSGQTAVKRFKIEAKPSANIFSEIEEAIRRRQGHLMEGRLEETAANRLSGVFTIQFTNTDDLKKVMKNIRGIPGLINIQPLN